MSALGHKQTYAMQKGMSALPPIATAKADMCSAGGYVRFGPKADFCDATSDVSYGSEADMCIAQAHVCFGREADI